MKNFNDFHRIQNGVTKLYDSYEHKTQVSRHIKCICLKLVNHLSHYVMHTHDIHHTLTIVYITIESIERLDSD